MIAHRLLLLRTPAMPRLDTPERDAAFGTMARVLREHLERKR
jgi:hypothetical protein